MKKKWTHGLALGLCMTMLTGCSFGMMSPKKILTNTEHAMSDVQSIRMVLDMDYQMTMTMAGETVPISIGLDEFALSVMKDKDGDLKAGHMKGSMNMGSADIGEMTVPMESYIVKENEDFVQYMSVSKSGWTKEVMDVDMQDSLVSILDWNQSDKDVEDKTFDGWELAKKPVDVNGTKAYQLRTILDGDKLMDSVNKTIGLESMTGLDLSCGDLELTQYVDKKDFYLIGVDLKTMDKTSDKKEDFEKKEEPENSAPGFDSLTLDIQHMNISIRCDKVNGLTADDLAVPEEIQKEAQETVSAGLGMLDEGLLSQGMDIPDTSDWDTESISAEDGVSKIEQDGYTLYFDSSDFGNVTVDNQIITGNTSDFKTVMTASIRNAFSGKDTVEQDRKSTDEYLKSEKNAGSVKDVNISDMKTTTLGAYKVYYYSEQYTDCSLNKSGDFVSKEYRFYIDCGDNSHVGMISVSEISDVAGQVSLTDTVALEILSHFEME